MLFVGFFTVCENAKSQSLNPNQSACGELDSSKIEKHSCSLGSVIGNSPDQSPCVNFEECRNFCRVEIHNAVVKSRKSIDELNPSCEWGSEKIDVLGRIGEADMNAIVDNLNKADRAAEADRAAIEALAKEAEAANQGDDDFGANEGDEIVTETAADDETEDTDTDEEVNDDAATKKARKKAASKLKSRMAKVGGADIDSELAKRKKEISKSDLSDAEKLKLTKKIDDLSAIKAVQANTGGGFSEANRAQMQLRLDALDFNFAQISGTGTNAQAMALFKEKLKRGIANGTLSGKDTEILNQKSENLNAVQSALAEDGLTEAEVAEIDALRKDLNDELKLKNHNQVSIWTLIVKTQAQLDNMKANRYLGEKSYQGLTDAVDRVKERFIALKDGKKKSVLSRDQKVNLISKILQIKEKAKVIRGNNILAKK